MKKELEFKNIRKIEHSEIPGWGIDEDLKNDPTYPVKKRTDEEHDGYGWTRPPLQPVEIEVLRSNERPNVTAVFGTSVPPSGLSGMIRRFAFRYGESSYGHWLPMLLADRINVAEGIIGDLAHGRFPNFWAEKGRKAEWNFNRAVLIRKLAGGAAAVSAILFLLNRRRKA